MVQQEQEAKHEQKRSRILTMGIFLFLVVYTVQMFYGGLSYEPIFADYLNFNAGIDTINPLNTGILTAPFNTFIWSLFWDKLSILQFALSAMYFGAVALLYLVFSQHFKITYLFFVICLLSPVAMEGTYYLSNAVSIVVPFFCMALGIYFLQLFAETQSPGAICLYFILQLLSFCFCKQVAILSLILAFMILWYNSENMNIALYVLTIINICVVVGAYYFVTLFTGQSILETQGISNLIGSLTSQFSYVFFGLGAELTLLNFKQGITLLTTNSVLYLPLIILVGCGVATIAVVIKDGKEKSSGVQIVGEVICGILIFIAPILPVLFIKDAIPSFQSVVPCLIGFALLSNTLYKNTLGKIKIAPAVFLGCIMIVCVVASINEINNYQRVGAQDNALLTEIHEKLKNTDKRDRVLLLNTPNYYLDGTITYLDHMKRITYDDETFRGAMVSKNKSANIGKVHLISSDEIKANYQFTTDELLEYNLLLGIVEDKVVTLTFTETPQNYELLDENGKVMWSAEKA